MSTFIQVPNSFLKLPSKRKNKIEALIYTAISGEIKDDTRQASFSQKALAKLIGKDERSINTYISDLKDNGFFSYIKRKHGEHSYPYNVYYIPYINSEYFYVNKDLIYRTDISAELKGLMLFIKANCWKGTNHLSFNGITTDLASKLQVGKNNLTSQLKELENKQYIRFIGKTLIITDYAFPLYIKNTYWNQVYEVIYKFCLFKDRIPPYKQVTKGRAIDEPLGMICAKYADTTSLLKALDERCKDLPENLSLNYFCQVLRSKMPEKNKEQRPLIKL